jgi:hypothetical protein
MPLHKFIPKDDNARMCACCHRSEYDICHYRDIDAALEATADTLVQAKNALRREQERVEALESRYNELMLLRIRQGK